MDFLTRRHFLKIAAWSAGACAIPAFPSFAWAVDSKALTKKIPNSKVDLPVIGMGTWITFNVGNSQKLRDAKTEVLKEFFKHGGGMIDSSPMYGASEAVVGYGLAKLNFPKTAFNATKVWTSSEKEGLQQIENSKTLWGLKKFDLLQVHNLDGWEVHLKNLFKLKEKGGLGHVGITTSHGRRHDEVERIMRKEKIDFVQLTYNIADRDAETKLLPLALDRGIAVIANRPLDGGDLMSKVRGKTLPAWGAEFDCKTWSQFFLKFVVSHPAITCAIPATSKVSHMTENMGAAFGRLPSQAQREKMIQFMKTL